MGAGMSAKEAQKLVDEAEQAVAWAMDCEVLVDRKNKESVSMEMEAFVRAVETDKAEALAALLVLLAQTQRTQALAARETALLRLELAAGRGARTAPPSSLAPGSGPLAGRGAGS